HDGGREPLELAIFGEDAMRGRDWATERFQRASDRVLARRIRIRMKQAYGKSLGTACPSDSSDARKFSAGQRVCDCAVEQGSFLDTEAHRARHQGLGARWRERVQFGAILPTDFDEVLETRVGEQRDARALELEQRVGRDGRTISQ